MLLEKDNDIVTLCVQHTLPDMTFGYQSNAMNGPNSRTLRKSSQSKVATFLEAQKVS